MVDTIYPTPMPSTIPSNRHIQNVSLPPLLSLPGSVVGGSKGSSRGGQPRNEFGYPFVPAEIRHGLRTPPRDMSGVSVNPLLAPNFGGCHYKSVPALASNSSTRQSSVSTIANTRYTNRVPSSQNTHHQKTGSRENTSLDRDVLNERTSSIRNGTDESSIVSYLQIPSSINESKGSLAEFAAQVRLTISEMIVTSAECL